MSVPRPRPRLDAVNRAFWTGGAVGELRFHRCQDCRAFIHPPQPLCSQCLSDNVQPEAVAGTGTIATYTINHQAWQPGLAVPYIVARVAIDGAPGVILTTNIIGCAVDEISFGDRVRVVFEAQGEIHIPLFEKIP